MKTKILIAFCLLFIGLIYVGDWIIFATREENKKMPWVDFKAKELTIRVSSLVLLISSALILIACNGECTYKIFEKIPNTKEDYRIVKFFNWCGFTASNNINFSVLKDSDSVGNRQKIVFIAASRVGANLNRDTTVKASWLNDSTVLFQHDKDLQIFKKELLLDEIKIEYMLK